MEDKTKIAVKPVGSQYHLKRDTKLSVDSSDKLKIFLLKQQEGHKILQNLHRRFVLCSASQIYGGDFANSTVEISQNFVAFSGYMSVS